jgi:hypothetical protein
MAAQTVSKGLATWAGIIAAVGQYAGAVAVYLDDPDKATAIGPLGTATLTLIVVIVGRMSQAKALAAPVQVPVKLEASGSDVARAVVSSSPRPMVDYSAEVPGGGVPPEIAS